MNQKEKDQLIAWLKAKSEAFDKDWITGKMWREPPSMAGNPYPEIIAKIQAIPTTQIAQTKISAEELGWPYVQPEGFDVFALERARFALIDFILPEITATKHVEKTPDGPDKVYYRASIYVDRPRDGKAGKSNG